MTNENEKRNDNEAGSEVPSFVNDKKNIKIFNLDIKTRFRHFCLNLI